MSLAQTIYNSTTTLDDWLAIRAESSDGEDWMIENKSVPIDLWSAQPSDVGDFKLLIAKEICAFANTNDGLIALGIGNGLVENNTQSLEDWLDKNCSDLIEPELSGVRLKTCQDSEARKFVLMYIPKGRTIPYRVKATPSFSKNKKMVREYYQRIGTSSKPIPFPIVRALYASNERTINVSACVKPVSIFNGSDIKQPYIELGIEITPDETRLINEYYLEATVLLLDEHLSPLHKTPIDIVAFGLNSPQRPMIPPDNRKHIIDTFIIQQKEQDSANNSYSSLLTNIPADGIEYIPSSSYPKIHGFYAETKFACDGLPLKQDKRLLIINDTVKTAELNQRAQEMAGWSKDCLVVSWFPVTDDSGLYHKIVGFMHNMGFEVK